MKNGVKIFSIILFLWIIACSYIYVCLIRKDCSCSKTENNSTVLGLNEDMPVDSLNNTETTTPEMITIHFRLGETECILSEEVINQISKLEKYLSRNPGKLLLVTGHTDNYGTNIINKEMSFDRAMFMKLKLVEGGIEPDIIEVTSMGSEQPVADNNTATGRLNNRRAETKIK